MNTIRPGTTPKPLLILGGTHLQTACIQEIMHTRSNPYQL